MTSRLGSVFGSKDTSEWSTCLTLVVACPYRSDSSIDLLTELEDTRNSITSLALTLLKGHHLVLGERYPNVETERANKAPWLVYHDEACLLRYSGRHRAVPKQVAVGCSDLGNTHPWSSEWLTKDCEEVVTGEDGR